ncbi:YobH family protein [Edwardsiella tarda]|uniref:YobH family protein n=1 Tax=Edwardsiella tarda TaxID=636 RepID=UPI003A889282
MRLLKTTLILLIIAYLAMLFSGYGFLVNSQKQLGGLTLECQYLSAYGLVGNHQLRDTHGVIGSSECPLLRAVTTPFWQR